MMKLIKTNKLFWFRVVFTVWVLFATLYVAYGEWNRFKATVYDTAYGRGQVETVARVVAEAQKCQPFPVNIGENKVTLVSVECLQKADGKAKGK